MYGDKSRRVARPERAESSVWPGVQLAAAATSSPGAEPAGSETLDDPSLLVGGQQRSHGPAPW